jgi:hypothetical protein
MRGMRRPASAWDDCANTRIPRYARGMRGMRNARPASASVRGQAHAACVPACRYYLSPRRTGCTCLALMHLHRDSMPSKLKVNDGFRRIASARAQDRRAGRDPQEQARSCPRCATRRPCCLRDTAAHAPSPRPRPTACIWRLTHLPVQSRAAHSHGSVSRPADSASAIRDTSR